nr:hypothetical protein [Agrobacterium vitis]
MIEQLKSNYSGLRPSEQRVADLLLQDPEAFRTMSSMEIAVEAGVGEATISRVCKAVGLRGFRELRDQLGDRNAAPG